VHQRTRYRPARESTLILLQNHVSHAKRIFLPRSRHSVLWTCYIFNSFHQRHGISAVLHYTSLSNCIFPALVLLVDEEPPSNVFAALGQWFFGWDVGRREITRIRLPSEPVLRNGGLLRSTQRASRSLSYIETPRTKHRDALNLLFHSSDTCRIYKLTCGNVARACIIDDFLAQATGHSQNKRQPSFGLEGSLTDIHRMSKIWKLDI
jgi:hypothetical protein